MSIGKVVFTLGLGLFLGLFAAVAVHAAEGGASKNLILPYKPAPGGKPWGGHDGKPGKPWGGYDGKPGKPWGGHDGKPGKPGKPGDTPVTCQAIGCVKPHPLPKPLPVRPTPVKDEPKVVCMAIGCPKL